MNKELEGKIIGVLESFVNKYDGEGGFDWISCGDNGFNEAASRIAALMPEPKPHIICLAEAHHYRLRPAMTAKAWIISLVRRGDRKDKHVFSGETFWEAERKAREYLEKMEDVK